MSVGSRIKLFLVVRKQAPPIILNWEEVINEPWTVSEALPDFAEVINEQWTYTYPPVDLQEVINEPWTS